MVDVVSPLAGLEQLWAINNNSFPWQILALILIGISFSVVAIAYMLGRMFDSDRLKKWAYGEFMTALATLILIGMFITFASIISQIVFSLSMELTRINYPAYYIELNDALSAKSITQDVVQFLPAQSYVNSVEKCVRQLYIINFCSALVAEPIGTSGGTDRVLPAVPSLAIRNAVRTFGLTTTYLSYATYIQKNMLLFIQQVALTIFLPLGIVLRTFPMTRGAGNLFIALSLGTYFVYPLSYSIMLMLSSPPAQFQNKCGITAAADTISDTGNCVRAMGQTAVFSAATLKWSSLLNLFSSKSATSVFGKIFSLSSIPIFATAASAPAIGAVWSFIEQSSSLIVESFTYAVVYPFVILAVVLTFVKAFSTFLGADAQDLVQGLFRIV